MKTLREIRDALSGWSATAVLLSLYAIALAAATLIEAGLGSEAARSAIYHAWWMYVLYALMIVNFLFIGERMKLIKRRRWGTLLLHGGFIVILSGAWITHLWGYEGTLHLREGEEFIPLIQLLKAVNVVYSGSDAQECVARGMVRRNGETETRKRAKIREGEVIEFDRYRILVEAHDPEEEL